MFREDVYPLIADAESLERTFQQKPTRIPLELPLQPTYIITQEPNVLPIVAIVGIFAFFGFLAFLVAMRRS